MKNQLLLFFNTVFLLAISTTAGAAVAFYDHTASASLYDFKFEFYSPSADPFAPPGFTFEESVEYSPKLFYSYNRAWLEDHNDNNVVNVWDENHLHESGPGYELTASSSSDLSLHAAIKTNGGFGSADSSQYLEFHNDLNGLLKISFSYDIEVDPSPSNDYGDAMVEVALRDDSGARHSFYHDTYEDGNIMNGQGQLSVFVTENTFYELEASAYTYLTTEAPLHTPLPAAVMLLGSGLLGLAGFSRRKA